MSELIVLCPGQGAQAVGLGKAWAESSPAAAAVFDEADRILADDLGTSLSGLCFEGPADRLNATNVSQPAIYTCSVACQRGLVESEGPRDLHATAGLSLGEYTALHLAGVFDFATGLRLVAARGRLMHEAAEAAAGSMVALIGADETQADELCSKAAPAPDEVLVAANFNAPGQIVLSGDAESCARAVTAAGEMGLRATALTVGGAFHSPLMQPAADRMGEILEGITFQNPNTEVWSNVTAAPHDPEDMELLKRRLVEQIVSPVKWARSCQGLANRVLAPTTAPGTVPGTVPGTTIPGTDADGTIEWRELAPGSVLRGLMRRIDRNIKVKSHDQPVQPVE